MKLPLTVIILTYNEELHIRRALQNVAGWAEEVIVVDSFSTDKTLEIAKNFGAKIYQHEFENQAKQFNWALNNLEIKTDWIFRLDADEYLTDELKKEIAEVLPKVEPEISGFFIKRRVIFMGRWIRHGGYYPTWILRLFRKGKARCEEREVDEHIEILDGRIGRLKNDFVDENNNKLSWWINKHNNYSDREVKAIAKAEADEGKNLGGGQVKIRRVAKYRIYYKLPLFCRAFLYFTYRYVFRFGFLDGIPGLVFHFLQGLWYRFLVDAKIYEKKLSKD